MKLALFHNLPSGGAKRHTAEQVHELARRGHEIVEFAPSTADIAFCSFGSDIVEQRVFEAATPIRRQRRLPLVTPYLHAVNGLSLLRRTAELNLRIADHIDQGGFDLALVKDCHLIMNPYVLRYLRTPTVFQCHHGLRHRVEEQNVAGTPERSLVAQLKSAYYAPARAAYSYQFRRDETHNIRSATCVATNSKFSQALIREHYGLDSRVLYPGINTNIFRPDGRDKESYVVCVGALIYSKGYRFLVSALGQIPQSRRPPLVVVANSIDVAEERKVRELAGHLDVDVRVETITDDRRLREVYGRASVFVYAPMQEALGMAPLEALACGTPVVAVAEGGVVETVEHGITGWTVKRDIAAFAAQLDELLGDEAARARMAAAGIDQVRKNWTWQNAVDRLETLFRTTLSSSMGQAA